MKKIQNLFFMIFGLLIVIFIIAVIVYILKFVIDIFLQADVTVVAALVAASGTIMATAFTVVVGQMISKNREIEEAHRAFKTEMYSKFINFTIDYVFSQTREDMESISQQELEKYFIKLSKDFTLWASPEVIKAWSKFRSQAGDSDSSDTLSNIDNVYKAMRKDLGNSNSGLQDKALINLYLNNSI